MNTAVIVAGGVGKRFGSTIPKQFMEINGVPIIKHAVAPFLEIDEIHRIVIACHREYIAYTENLFKNEEKITIIQGGETRFHSCKNAIEFLQNTNTKNVLMHDAARPIITTEVIKQCLDILKTCKAVTVAVPVKDTIIQVQNGIVNAVPHRSEMFANQTPQCFDFELISKAYQNATHENFTDDVSVVMGMCSVYVVQGSEKNIKITHKEDVELMKIFLGR